MSLDSNIIFNRFNSSQATRQSLCQNIAFYSSKRKEQLQMQFSQMGIVYLFSYELNRKLYYANEQKMKNFIFFESVPTGAIVRNQVPHVNF